MSFGPFKGFFSSVFGRDCSEIEADPSADPFDKEICKNFKQFEESLEDFSRLPLFTPPAGNEDHPEGNYTEDPKLKKDDPQSLRDSILSPRHNTPRNPVSRVRKTLPRPSGDENLDEQVERDPSLLDGFLEDKHEEAEPEMKKNHSSSVEIVTVRRPDRSIEKRETVRDSDGNEEVTVTITGPNDRRSPTSRGEGNMYFGRLSDWLWSK